MRPSLLAAVAASVLCLPTLASAAGPVIQGGMMRTTLTDGGDARYGQLDGGGFKVGFEVGSGHLRNEWAFNYHVLTGFNESNYGNHRLTLGGFSYQLSFMFLKTGFTPYLGLGVEGGQAVLQEDYRYSSFYGGWAMPEVYQGLYLRPYGIAGLRMQFGFGLGLRAEVTVSYFREFVAVGTNLGLSYTW